MESDRRDVSRQIRVGLAVLLLSPTIGACSAAIVAGGAVAGLVGISALTSHCYDYLDVSVFDEHGRKTCAATVTVSNGGDHFQLESCYYAPLSDGIWKLRATSPGYPDAVSTVEVEHAHDCIRHVQSVELTFSAARSAPRSSQAPVATSSAPSLAPPPLPPLPPALPAPPTPPPPPPPIVSAPAPVTVQIPTPSAVPAASAAPPVGVFPDQTKSPH